MIKKSILMATAALTMLSVTVDAEEKDDFLGTLNDALVNSAGEKVNPDLKSKDYVAFYYSAAWCPPCRKFTPSLVKFYDEHKDKGNFELILVSSDRDKKSALGYMTKYNMNFPTVEFSKIKSTNSKKFAGRGIPFLVVIDKEGKVVSTSAPKGKYRGCTPVMNELKELISAPAETAALTR